MLSEMGSWIKSWETLYLVGRTMKSVIDSICPTQVGHACDQQLNGKGKLLFC
jgi:hypothetical protein